jgi:hypothetical protein
MQHMFEGLNLLSLKNRPKIFEKRKYSQQWIDIFWLSLVKYIQYAIHERDNKMVYSEPCPIVGGKICINCIIIFSVLLSPVFLRF